MTSATIFEAKTNLSELIQKVEAGEEVVITRGRDKVPVARIMAMEPPRPKPFQRLGALQHLNLHVPDAFFFDPLPAEELRLWEGEEESQS